MRSHDEDKKNQNRESFRKRKNINQKKMIDSKKPIHKKENLNPIGEIENSKENKDENDDKK